MGLPLWPSPLPEDRNDESVVRLARDLCEADGVDPDAQAYWGEPKRFQFGYFVPKDTWPAWMAYRNMAYTAINSMLEVLGKK